MSTGSPGDAYAQSQVWVVEPLGEPICGEKGAIAGSFLREISLEISLGGKIAGWRVALSCAGVPGRLSTACATLSPPQLPHL